MKIKTIKVSGYRQLQDITIDLEDRITIVGGPNNSGKTSLIELFKWVFGKGANSKIERDDFPILSCQQWCNNIFPGIKKAFLSGKEKKVIIADVCELLFPIEEKKDPITIKPIQVNIHVTYDKELDKINLFSGYNMEVENDTQSFYFVYEYAIDKSKFSDNLAEKYEKFAIRINNLPEADVEKSNEPIRILKDMLLSLYHSSCKDAAYFANNLYNNKNIIATSEFKKLFNYENIMANRALDDEGSQKLHTLSMNLINTAKSDDNWKTMRLSLPDKILKHIQDTCIKTIVQTTSVTPLQNTLEAISKTNNQNPNRIIIDMDVTEESIQTLIECTTHAKYQVDDWFLSESSQGLGYSNLIFLHLQLERFRNILDPFQVNFFVIEEPEAHMHPQMQQVFTEYLFKYYAKATGMQGLITTHSSEVIKKAEIPNLRILRQTENYACVLFNLRTFYESQKQDLKEFYDSFYAISFPDIVFADKVILYEGDTERMLIKQGLQDIRQLEPLIERYLSYIQVGGAYAYKYVPLLEFLKIKSVIITDLDYKKHCTQKAVIEYSPTTNPTINSFFPNQTPPEDMENANEAEENEKGPTVKELWAKKTEGKTVFKEGLIYLSYPGENDGYARTLEEAMLAKKYRVTVSTTMTEQEWKKLRKDAGLNFSIPKKEDLSIRDIVTSTSSGKTDFMYSVILGKKTEEMFPDYIKEALVWLIN